MVKKVIDSRLEESKLKQCQMFSNRGFMVTVLDDEENIVFSPYMISNFSIDGNKIFITVYDLIQKANIEQKLDELSKGFCMFKSQLSIILMRLDNANKEVYSVKYGKCKLRKYHGKNFTYKGNEPHQWYLELSFKSKEIINNKDFDFLPIILNLENIPTQEELNKKYNYSSIPRHKRMVKKEVEILKNTNKMLDEAAEKVKSNNKLNDTYKKNKLNEINKAKNENKDNAMKQLGVNIDFSDLKKIEKEMESTLLELEN